MKPRTEKLRFSNARGHALEGRLELPAGTPRAFALFCHCFTCSKDTLAAFRVSRELAARGYAVLRFDFTGLGSSEGEFADTDFSSNVDDIRAAVGHLAVHFERPRLYIGHSLGGTALLEAALTEPPDGVVTIASPSQPAHVLHHFGPAIPELAQGLDSSIEVAGRRYPVRPQLVDNLQRYDMQQRLAGLHIPVLIFNVVNDALVSGDHADKLARWIPGETRVIQLETADHILSQSSDSSFVAATIAEWFEQIR